ncbi:MAG: hypothetical protein ABSF14_20290 [Terriglobia bacterium]|jgi:hypothetical protein
MADIVDMTQDGELEEFGVTLCESCARIASGPNHCPHGYDPTDPAYSCWDPQPWVLDPKARKPQS